MLLKVTSIIGKLSVKHIPFISMLHAAISEAFYFYIAVTCCYQWSIFLSYRCYMLLSMKHIFFKSILRAAINKAYLFHINATRCYQWRISHLNRCTRYYQLSILLLHRCYTLLSVKHISFISMLHAAISEAYYFYIDTTCCYQKQNNRLKANNVVLLII